MRVFLRAFAVILLCNTATSQSSVAAKMQEALRVFSSGDVASATALFEEIIKEEPKHGPARLMLGQIALEQGDAKLAQEHLEIAVASQPQRIHLAWHLLGKAQLLQHQYEKARESFDESLKASPNFLPAIQWRARANLFLNQFDPAIEDLQRVNDSEAELLLAEVFVYQNNRQTALQILSGMDETTAAGLFIHAMKGGPAADKNIKILLGENLGSADAYLAAGIHFKSDALLEIAYHIDDQNPVIHLFLKKSGKSIPDFSILSPRVIQIMALASNALNQKNFEEAEKLAQQIIADRPMHVPALLIQVEAAEKQQKNWEALATYKQLMQWLSDVPAISTRLAILARNMQANEAAECSIRKAISAKPEEASLHYILATILKQKGKITEAIEACKHAIELGFQEAAAYVTLGNLYYEKMDISQAMEALESAIEKNPEAAEDIASFALAVLTASDSVQLREILEKHAANHPENINTLYSLGVLYLNQNNFEKAKQYLLQVEKLAPKNSQVYYNLGLIYTREENETAALKAMTRFEELKTEERNEWTIMNQAFRIRQEAKDAIQKGDHNQAIEHYSRIDKQGVAEKEDLLALSQLYLNAKEFQNAASILDKVLFKSPYEVEAIKLRLEVATQLKNPKDMELYRNQLELLSSLCKISK